MEGTVTISTAEYLSLVETSKAFHKDGIMYHNNRFGYVSMKKSEFGELVAEEQSTLKGEIQYLKLELKNNLSEFNRINKTNSELRAELSKLKTMSIFKWLRNRGK